MKATSLLPATLRRTLFSVLRALFYQCVFARPLPFATALARRVHAWERRHGLGDVPLAAAGWEAHYGGGRWQFLAHLEQVARYSVLVGYMAYLKPGGAVLDVGCGEGILFARYRPYGYARYVGIDIAAAALATLAPAQDEKTRFLRAEAETYRPAEQFDVIVFNETLYYFHDPLAVLEKYAHALKPGGLVLLSTYAGSGRARAILRRVKARWLVVSETRTRQGAKTWICSVLAPLPPAAPRAH